MVKEDEKEQVTLVEETKLSIKELKERICRIEKVIIGGLFAIFLALLSNNF